MGLSDKAQMLGWMGVHEHAIIVAKQLQTMFHSDRWVIPLMSIVRGWIKFSDDGGGPAGKDCKEWRERSYSSWTSNRVMLFHEVQLTSIDGRVIAFPAELLLDWSVLLVRNQVSHSGIDWDFVREFSVIICTSRTITILSTWKPLTWIYWGYAFFPSYPEVGECKVHPDMSR